jgi:hypothetical protein
MIWRECVPRVAVIAVAMAACTSAPPKAAAQAPSGPPPGPAAWERQEGDAFENRGVAKVQQIGTRWALTVMCSGIHTTYLDDTKIDVAAYVKGYVNARYRWVTRTVTDVKCPVMPCGPVRERRIALERLTVAAVTAQRADELAKDCGRKAN